MLELSVDSIYDYQTCGLLYDFKYITQEDVPILEKDIFNQRYENILRKVVSFFFYKRQGGTIPSYNTILNRWEKLWFPKDMTAEDLSLSAGKNNWMNYSNNAALSLLKFYEDFSGKIGEPIAIDENYIVPLGKEIKLTGKFDVVLQLGNVVSVVKINTSNVKPTWGTSIMSLAAMRYAFEFKNSERDLRVQYLFYDVGSQSPGFVKMQASQKDINALNFWANEIKNAKFFVPRRGLTSYCRKCPFDKPCSKFEFSKELLESQ